MSWIKELAETSSYEEQQNMLLEKAKSLPLESWENQTGDLVNRLEDDGVEYVIRLDYIGGEENPHIVYDLSMYPPLITGEIVDFQYDSHDPRQSELKALYEKVWRFHNK